MEVAAFYIFALLAIVTSLLVVGQRNPMHSVMLLIASFGALAGLYVLLDAPFTAVTQIIIYAGAIMVLFLFVVMLLNLPREEPAPPAIAAVRPGRLRLRLRGDLHLDPGRDDRRRRARAEGVVIVVPLNYYLILSGILFAIGTAGVFLRRNLITVMLSIEIMLNAVNLTFVAVGRYLGTVDGQIITFFVMTVAAAEAAVGLALVIALFRHRETLSPDAFTALKW
jgi:NADH-quinone oxidoreductase subunit K